MDYRLRRISPKYISAGELPAKGDLVVTIERIETRTVVGEGGRENTMGCLYFKGWKKGWLCNAGNGATIRKLYGEDDDAWIGKPIAIYRGTRKVGDDPNHPCMFVRPSRPKEARADAEPVEPDDDFMRRVCAHMEAATSRAKVEELVKEHEARVLKLPPALKKLAQETYTKVVAALPKEGDRG